MTRRDLIFRVFVSSTFSDLVVERNALQEVVFPALREHCRQNGARFQAIDLRWGVSQEASLDQQTMDICFQELERCQEMSPKPNFIVLLGNRYGWRPLPTRIPTCEFEELLTKTNDQDKQFLLWTNTPDDPPPGEAWYARDDNARPALPDGTVVEGEYVLRPRRAGTSEAEFAEWQKAEERLRSILLQAARDCGWPPDDPRLAKYIISATHHEIMNGALNPQLDPEDHVFCYFRDIKDLPQDGSAAKFRDMLPLDEVGDAWEPDGNGQGDLEMLKSELRTRLPDEHVFEYDVPWNEIAARDAAPSSVDYANLPPDLAALCERVRANLLSVIDREIAAFHAEDGLVRENRSHREFAEDRSRHFIGRRDILDHIKHYLASPQEQRPLVIHGRSGSGKTALMAKAWFDVADTDHTAARFIGATPESADLRTLLRSLCQQLGIESPPTDMNELVNAFRNRLSGTAEGEETQAPPAPAVVFLDALDQLNATDNARMLYWLPRELAPNVKLVMSALQAEGESGECFDIAGRIWPEALVEVGALGRDDGEELLTTLLDEAGRTLQREQAADVIGKFAADGRPLYLKLAFEEARLWKSWEGLPCGADDVPGLDGTVEGILIDMLHRLELPRNHGPVLVAHALGGIACAKSGLTEDELLDVLSREQAVMRDYLDRNPESPNVERLPVVVWSRLHADLRPYMTQRRADGTVVMNFYHRQVAEAINARYFGDGKEQAKLDAHARLAEYFHGLDYWAESLEDQRARAKRLPPTPRPANIRKVVELPHHRLAVAKLVDPEGNKPDAKEWDDVADLLTDWQFLEAKAEADPTGKHAAEQAAESAADAGGETQNPE